MTNLINPNLGPAPAEGTLLLHWPRLPCWNLCIAASIHHWPGCHIGGGGGGDASFSLPPIPTSAAEYNHAGIHRPGLNICDPVFQDSLGFSLFAQPGFKPSVSAM